MQHAPGPPLFAAGPGRPRRHRRSASAALLGEPFVDGGVHPRFGTRNMILPLADDTYLEVVEVLDHPASDKAPFGQAVRARSALGGGWLGWVVAVDDIAPLETRLGREAVDGNRHRPDGTELRWKQIGVNGLIADPQLPFFIEWERPGTTLHPSRRQRRRLAGVPGDRRRPAAGQRVARRDRRGSRSRTSRSSGSPRTARPASSPRSSRPATGSSGSERFPRLSPGRRAQPQHLGPPATYEVENRAVDRDGLVEAAMRSRGVLGRPRPCSTSAAAPASTCRVRGDRGRAWSASSRTPTWWRSPGGVRRALPNVVGARRAPHRRCRCRTRRSTWCTRAGPTSSAPAASPACRARPRRTPRRHGVRDRQRRDPVDVRRLVPPRLPGRRPRRGRAVLVAHGWTRHPVDIRLAVRHPRGPRGRRPHRVRRRRTPRRCWPSTPAPRSTTPSTSWSKGF